MEEAPKNSKESSHSAHASGMNECLSVKTVLKDKKCLKIRRYNDNVLHVAFEVL